MSKLEIPPKEPFEYYALIAKELSLKEQRVEATVTLLDGAATVPFIARYRKEVTGSLDEVAITRIRDRIHQLRELDKRRATVLQSIHEQGKLTEELKKKILAAETMTVLEDLYLPFRPKRRTRAIIAQEKGLEPLAKAIFAQTGIDCEEEAKKYVDEKKKVVSVEEALAGARDIIAEWVNENIQARQLLRKLYTEKGVVRSRVIRGKEEEGVKYKDYFEWEQLGAKAPSHRILASRRGEKEGILMVRVIVPEKEAVEILRSLFVRSDKADSGQVAMALEDSFKRLLSVSIETEIRLELKRRADQEAVKIFNENLRQLLMAPPMGQKAVMAIDPGVRTGCKVVCLDPQGKFLEFTTVYLSTGESKKEQAHGVLKNLVEKHRIEVIAIGNGTASRETESFVKSVSFEREMPIVMVSETGASIYSASEVAREEFPDFDVTVRGSVSIGRRLMDPLAELVKIDPKSIGIGQYQHDVDQKLLRQNLDDVVTSCVNQVGVEINTASKELLTYVSGLGPARAQSIIDHRNKKGPFKSRTQLYDISGLGEKAVEQAAGFLRIRNAQNPLDASAVHIESYSVVEAMARDLNCPLIDLMTDQLLRERIPLEKYVTAQFGMPTLLDIKLELAKPGRDPRPPFELFTYKEGVETMEDIQPGMTLTGVVTNITAFGVFVDVGVHHDALIHISQLSDRFVKDPHEIVHVHQKITATVLEVDLHRQRIALTLRGKPN